MQELTIDTDVRIYYFLYKTHAGPLRVNIHGKTGVFMNSQVIQVSKADFEREVEQSSVPVLVDFWAEWCMPCRSVAPLIDELAQQYAGRVKFCKINVDNEPDLSNKFSIISIPTLMVFSNGKMHKQKIGAQPKHQI